MALGRCLVLLTISGIKINIWPVVTDADMGRIEILLGTEAITQPGLTMVVRQGKAMLLEEESPNKWMSSFGMPEVEEGKYVIRLAEELCCESFASEMVKVDVSGKQGGDFVIVDKVVTTEQGYLMIHGQLLKLGMENQLLKVTNLTKKEIHWRKGRVLFRLELGGEKEAKAGKKKKATKTTQVKWRLKQQPMYRYFTDPIDCHTQSEVW
ncbi:unnamed protein product [Brassicogethes aeneus]|uniref:Uncharacterized protein n=1 Tax=Brassicogethes aeneus TaxID=1431903 RepID=A0A9P0AY39_BRAAE|nr:unnamed protein product [Brassicogethes aeneus]